MKYSSEDPGIFTSANMIALEDNQQEKNNQKRKNIIFIIVLSILLISLLIVYVSWLKVPTKKHFLRAEYITSTDTSKKLRAEIILPFPKTLDLRREERPQLANIDFYQISDVFLDTSIAEPQRNYIFDSLDSYIGQIASSVFREYCDSNSIMANKYSEIFLFRHLDNEKRSNIINTTFEPINPGNKFDLDHFSFYEKNRFLLSDSIRESSLGLNLNGFEISPLINSDDPYSRKKQNNLGFWKDKYLDFSNNGLNNVFTSIVLAKNKTKTFGYYSKMPKKNESRLLQVFKMEDISQARYSIKIRSESIPEIKLKLLYGGSIECLYRNKLSIDYNFSNNSIINVGHNFIEVLKNQSVGDLTLDFRVQFIDMQNVQRIRLFLLTAIITLVLTSLIKLIWVTITGTDNGLFSKKQNNKKTIVKVASERRKNLIYQENDIDIPSNTPDYYKNPPCID